VAEAVVFWVLAMVAVGCGAAVFWVDSMARATYALAVSFVAVGAVLLLLLGSQYVGIITVLMMVMEMAVMAIYMLMFMGMNPALMPMSMVHNRRWSLVLAVGTFAVLAGGALLVPWPTRRAPAGDVTAALGEAVMGSKMLVMLTVSPVLFATVVAALVLASPRGRYDRLGDDLRRRPPADPQRGGVGR